MSATGTMQIILALIAMNYRLIGGEIFASLVFVAVITSLTSSPLMKLFLRSEKAMNLLDCTEKRLFVPALVSRDRDGVIGELAIFGPERVPPELPAYDHAGLDACMGAVLAAVRELLGAQVAVPYDRVAFTPDGAQEGVFHAALPAEWFGRSPQFYLGVVIEEPAERAAELVAAGTKLLAPVDLESVLQGVLPGVRLDPVRLPPTAFPKRPGLHFFRVDTEGESRQYWLHVAEAGRALVLSALGGLGVTDYAMFVELRN